LHLSNAALALFLLFWIVALHGPLVTAAPGDVRRWLYLGEVLAIACGALMLWATPGHGRAAMAARLGFALSLLTFGASHFAYLKVTAAVVPAYIPAPMAVARITGAAHVAAGLALLSNLLPRLAAALEAAMMSVFVLLVNAPDVLSSPTNRGAWTALLAEGGPRRRRLDRGRRASRASGRRQQNEFGPHSSFGKPNAVGEGPRVSAAWPERSVLGSGKGGCLDR
jgi:uncharacterized membrane protein YphA (DoxX/SURF4 family)